MAHYPPPKRKTISEIAEKYPPPRNWTWKCQIPHYKIEEIGKKIKAQHFDEAQKLFYELEDECKEQRLKEIEKTHYHIYRILDNKAHYERNIKLSAPPKERGEHGAGFSKEFAQELWEQEISKIKDKTKQRLKEFGFEIPTVLDISKGDAS